MLYISTMFCEIISKDIEVIERTRFLYLKLQRGIIPQKNVGGMTVFNLWYQSYRADTISILKISKRNNSTKNVGGVTVVNLCTSSGHVISLTSFVTLSQTVSKL